MRTRVLIVCFIISLSVFSLYAQDKSDRYHRFGSEKRLQLNGYIGPIVAFSSVEGTFSTDLGATGGLFIRKKFYMGIYGQKLISAPVRSDLASIGYPTYTNGEIDMIHTGGILGYIHKPKDVIHWGVSGSAGVGILYLKAKNPTTQVIEKLYNDRIYIAIPKLFVEINMTRWFKLNMSGGYRIVGKVNGTYVNKDGETIPTFNQSDYSKPEFSMSLLFGVLGTGPGFLD